MEFNQELKKLSGFIWSRAHRYFMAGGAVDDLYQEGCIGLMEAIRDYDDSKGQTFNTFAKISIERNIINAVRKSTRKKHDFITHATRNEYIIHRNGAFISPEMYAILKERLSEVNVILTDIEKISFFMQWQGYAYVEIARALNCSDKRVENAIGRARRKIKTILGGYYD